MILEDERTGDGGGSNRSKGSREGWKGGRKERGEGREYMQKKSSSLKTLVKRERGGGEEGRKGGK